MTTPIATYRLQLRNGFTFTDAVGIVPYLAKLGISHVYLSPIFRSAPGSTHGYDALDFNEIEPLLGGAVGFDALIEELKRFGLKAIVDFVPNHMAAHPDNPWWRDVLEWGDQSQYANYFDIDWSAPKLLIPTLGKPYGETLSAGELSLGVDAYRGEIVARYFDSTFPLSPSTYGNALEPTDDTDINAFVRAAKECVPERSGDLKADFKGLLSSKRKAVEEVLRQLNAKTSELHSILERQPWRLAYWRAARERLTYRRFFEISDLIGVRVERPDVFADVHRTILALVEAGKVDGLRIDHVDGLADPKSYLEQLRKATDDKPDLYLVVEKILGEGEDLRTDWPVDGTTGYEFIRDVSGLFVSDSLTRLHQAYREFTSASHDYEAETLAVKRRTLSFNLAAELRGLVARAVAIAGADIRTRDFGPEVLRAAITEVAVRFTTYRTYVNRDGVMPADVQVLETVAKRAKSSREVEDPAAIDFIISLLSEHPVSPSVKHDAEMFAVRFQQTTGPLMAKAVEDTEFYRFNRLIALNEVGGEPDEPRGGVAGFHAAMQRRQMLAPRALSATATHDTKRGEDSRARLYGISKIQDEWSSAVERWRGLLETALSTGEHVDRESMWLFFQALSGAWPIDGDRSGQFVERIEQFMIKASREAKVRTSWTNPDADYEDRIKAFIRRTLSSQNAFVDDFVRTIDPLVKAGAAASIVQTALKILAPGVPDIYQGTEAWDFSLVDPDNRRPVDYECRQRLLADASDLQSYDERDWREGRVKLDILLRSLALRRDMDFVAATYEPLQVHSGAKNDCFAFLRRVEGRAIIFIGAIPSPEHYQDPNAFGFKATSLGPATIPVPLEFNQRSFAEVFSGTRLTVEDGMLKVAEALRSLPVAVLLPVAEA